MNLEFEVLVLGGGIVGLSAALAMAQRGYRVAIIDAGSLTVDTSRPDARVYAINYASQTLLQQVGAWQRVDPQHLAPYQHMHVWDAVNGAHIDFDSRSVAAPYLGVIIEEAILKLALLQQVAQQANISLFPDCCVDAVHPDLHHVQVCSQQQVWEGQLLMIADGANSPARQKLKVELTSWPYKQQAIVATVAVEKAHQQTAYQVFNPDGPLAFLPLADAKQCSIVWSTTPLQAKKLLDLADDEFNEVLTTAFAQKLGQVQVISKRYQFPLHMRHVKQYSGNRWLLLGDAAHTIHPLAGLGLNVGLADVASWIHCLDTAQGALVSKKALGAYQRERKHAVWQIIALMEGFKRLFSNSFMPVVTLRGLGLGFCNQFTPLKRLFIQHARGLVE
ncbi:UbiH/UbiF/VisC/COQ6 family ubiquinone biosynthesis hydroxylase [Legionella drancourtii]|uniref:UbiH/UbiF/VisC/COQ6 family ubiquinone biosynthesis hydroxylase n=1 Tax=Legionella drancourtii TaxID=168933 RepID=UPI0001B02411|nr:UbiH/UbiF/VisC/COQ6 family ubiquinone biosynthesis hydroxylase [Legionella drancourtii]